MPPRRGRRRGRRNNDDDFYDSSDSESESFPSDESSDEDRSRKKRKRYSSDDDYDPVRDNVTEATNYKKSKSRHHHQQHYQQQGSHQQEQQEYEASSSNQWQQPDVRQQTPVQFQPIVPNPFQLIHSGPVLDPTTNTIIIPASSYSAVQQLQLLPQQSGPQVAAFNPFMTLQVPAVTPVISTVPLNRPVAEENVLINLSDDDPEPDYPLVKPQAIVTTRKSDLESRILNEISALAAPVVTLDMECETVCEDPDHFESAGVKVRNECPEYEYGLRRTVFNNDLILTCETVCEEDDCSYAYREEISSRQQADYLNKLKAFQTYEKIYQQKQESGIPMKHVDLSVTRESLDQFKDRLRQELRQSMSGRSSQSLLNTSLNLR